MSGMMWPMRTIGNPRIVISHTCVDIISGPSGRVTEMELTACLLFLHGAPFDKKKEVAPVLAIAREGSTNMPKACWGTLPAVLEVLDVTTVVTLSSDSMSKAAT